MIEQAESPDDAYQLHGIDRDLLSHAAKVYESMAPQADLSSKSTFSLLSSFALIGLSLASAKPQSVQVLGFTIQADHWLALALPLAMVVAYAGLQLVLSWLVEIRRYRYVVAPMQVDLGRELSFKLRADTNAGSDSLRLLLETVAARQEKLNSGQAQMDDELVRLDLEREALEERRRLTKQELDAALAKGLDVDERSLDYSRVVDELRQLRELRASAVSMRAVESDTENEKLEKICGSEKERSLDFERRLRFYRQMKEALDLSKDLNGWMSYLGLWIPVVVSLFAIALLGYMAVK